jgi:hypothetical protein
MVDGVSAVDIGTVILDVTPGAARGPGRRLAPAPAAGRASLVVGALTDYVKRPTQALDTARSAVFDARATASKVAGSRAACSPRPCRSPAGPDSPLNVRIGEQRRFGMAATDLDDYKLVRKAHGGTVNDVVLRDRSRARCGPGCSPAARR